MIEPFPGTDSMSCVKGMRWFVGVPVVTNRFILRDFFRAMLIASAGIFSLLLLVMFVFEGIPGGEQVWVAFSFACRLAFFILCAFVLFGVAFFRNRYAVLYGLDPEGIYCESMTRRGGSLAESFQRRPFPVEEMPSPGRSAVKTLSWEKIGSVRPEEDMLTLLLKGNENILMRIYCPDMEIFSRALEVCRAMVKEKNMEHGEGKG